MKGKELYKKELDELKLRVTEELKMLKHSKFPGMSDTAFEAEFGLSRGVLPGFESEPRSWPEVPTIYTVARHCGSSLTHIFRGQSHEYSEEYRELHRKLEYILNLVGTDHHVVGVINDAYRLFSPPPRAPRKRKPPSGPQSKKAGAVTVGS